MLQSGEVEPVRARRWCGVDKAAGVTGKVMVGEERGAPSLQAAVH